MKKKRIELLTGNKAAAWGVRLARPEVIAAYPITPQTTIVEYLARWCAEGKLNAEFINTESEQAVMGLVHGVALTGKRTFTATSSQGLLYMYEMLYWHATMRLPLVFVNVTRALGAPFNIRSDHNDAMSIRDLPAVQFFCATSQEILDHIIMGYKLAENQYFTVIINYEGFYVSHTGEAVEVPDQKMVDKFLGKFRPRKNLYISSKNQPKSFAPSNTVNPDAFFAMRKKTFEDLEKSQITYQKIAEAFADRFGRKYEAIETYRCEDAKTIILTLGILGPTAKIAIDRLREQGEQCGLIRLVMFKPFPAKEIIQRVAFSSLAEKLIVLESSNMGVFFDKTRSAFCNRSGGSLPKIYGRIVGVGGKEVTPNLVEQIVQETKQEDTPEFCWKE